MNYPVGNVKEKGPTPYKADELLIKLNKEQFNGYIIQSISEGDFEEGTLFFKSGKSIGGIVECNQNDFVEKGQKAISYFLNQSKGRGFYQVVELSESQIDLITAFDKSILFKGKLGLKDLLKIIPHTFKRNFESSGTKQSDLGVLEELKKNLLR